MSSAGVIDGFLVHGNVFDLVPGGGRLLSVPAFLDEVMFATYDVVLRYDRSRGVRATRGAEDWGGWLDQALGREGNLASLLREAGSALELIDRYLLRTINLKALGSRSPEAAAAGKGAYAFGITSPVVGSRSAPTCTRATPKSVKRQQPTASTSRRFLERALFVRIPDI